MEREASDFGQRGQRESRWGLAGRFSTPKPYRGYFSRPRLLKRLDAAREYQMTCIDALPGYGKTSLLADWMASHEGDLPQSGFLFAFFSASEDNNDIVFSLNDIGRSLRGIEGLALPEPLPDDADFEAQFAFMEALLTALDRIPSSAHLFFIIDDVQRIKNPVVFDTADYFLSHCPENVHTVYGGAIGRRSFAEKRILRHEAQIISSHDLRFTSEEIDSFFKSRVKGGLEAEELSNIERVTEGWPFALQLIAYSLDSIDESTSLLDKLPQSYSSIDDFIARSILTELPSRQYEFLLQTSQLPLFCLELCQRATSVADAPELLAPLREAGLFKSFEREGRCWYTGNRLLSRYLVSRAYETMPRQMRALAQEASAWYYEHDMVGLAIELSNRAEDWPRSSDLLQDAYRSFAERSRFQRLLSLVNAIPDSFLVSDPMLTVVKAWAYMGTDRPDEADRLIKAVRVDELEPTSHHRKTLQTEIAIIGATDAAMRGDTTKSRELIDKIPDGLDGKSPDVKTWAYNALATTTARQADCHESLRIHSLCEESALRTKNITVELITGYFKGLDYVNLGKLDTAYRQFGNGAKENVPEIKRSPFSGLPYLGMAAVEYERNEIPQAREHLDRCIPLLMRNDSVEFLVSAYLLQARLLVVSTHLDQAREILRRCAALAQRRNARRVANLVDLHSIFLGVIAGNEQQAQSALGRHRFADFAEDAPLLESANDTLMTLLLAKRDYGSLLKVSDALLARAGFESRFNFRIRLYAFRALALFGKRRKREAVESLERALEIGMPESYVRSFIDGMSGIEPVLDAYIASAQTSPGGKAEALSRYARTLRLSLEAKAEKPAAVKVLTAREREILELLIGGFSNRDIAQALTLSESTVHTHRMNIYAKLDVHNRRELIATARMLGML